MTSFDDSAQNDATRSPGMSESQLRSQVAARTAAAIHGVVRVMSRPTLAMVLAPILPGIILIGLGFLAPGKVYVVTAVIGVLAVVLGLRMWWLRRRFIRAASDRGALEVEIRQALDLTGHVVDARQQAYTSIESTVSSANSMNDARRVLGDLGLGANLQEKLGALPRLRPFTPSSLKSTFVTGTFCFTAAGILTVLNVVLVIVVIVAAL